MYDENIFPAAHPKKIFWLVTLRLYRICPGWVLFSEVLQEATYCLHTNWKDFLHITFLFARKCWRRYTQSNSQAITPTCL